MDTRPAQIIKSKFPTQPCLLRFHLERTLDGKRIVSQHPTVAFVHTILDETYMAPGDVRRGKIKAFLVVPELGREVKEIFRNLDLEESNNDKAFDPLTFNVLRNSEIVLVPTTDLMRETILGLLHQMKDGFVNHAAEAMKVAGDVGSKLDALALRVAGMPGHEAMAALQTDMLAVRALAETGRVQMEAVLATANRELTVREERLAQRERALESRMAAIEEVLTSLRADVRTMYALAPSTEDHIVAQGQDSKVVRGTGDAGQDPADNYRSKLATMNVGQLLGEYKRLKLTQPVKGTGLPAMREQLLDAYRKANGQPASA